MRIVELAPKRIRIDCTMPGPAQTPMMDVIEQVANPAVLNSYAVPTGRRATPEEQGNPLVLLDSRAASFVSGGCLPVDEGFSGGVSTGAIDMQALLARVAAPAAS